MAATHHYAEFYSSSPAEVVIAVDFGTTFSGFAYARTSSNSLAQPPEILDNCRWPGDSMAGAKPYCKNQTSLFYTPSTIDPSHFELQEWGWSAFNAFNRATSRESAKLVHPVGDAPSSDSKAIAQYGDVLNIGEGLEEKVGFFAHKFKLYLAPDAASTTSSLPGDLTPERLVVDYLRNLTEYIMDELEKATGKGLSKEGVQWCLTVPAIWNEDAKQAMRVCAEKAGMVKGAMCPKGVTASPRALKIILEPEAASMYCQSKARHLKLIQGDRILVADVGGGTIDLVVHEIVESDPRMGVTKVREVVASYGDTGGGTFVDDHFFELLCKKIGCFEEFCRDMNPAVSILIYSWWQRIKTDFDGEGYSAELSLADSALGKAWEQHDKEQGIERPKEFYQELVLEDTEIMSIFDPEVDKLVRLIEQQIETARVLMVVGGFAGSVYLRKRLFSRFDGQGMVEEIIIPENPGSAICKGAVLLQMNRGYIESRISQKTYGICTLRDAEDGDPVELIIKNEGVRKCTRAFSVFVRAGDSVALDDSKEQSYFPSFRGQESMLFTLYSSPKVYPKYTTETDAKEEGRFIIDISEAMELDKRREVEVTMVFGDSLISVSAARLNFGTKLKEQALSVTFNQSAP